MASTIPRANLFTGQQTGAAVTASEKMDQSLAAMDKAACYEQKAEAAENDTAISSDDPEAIVKLTEKLETLQITQTWMKQINAYYNQTFTSNPPVVSPLAAGAAVCWAAAALNSVRIKH